MYKNFTLEELINSDTANMKKIKNIPDFDQVRNWDYLVEKVLQPLRDWYGKTIAVKSGYRSAELNNAVGGAKNSQHMVGEAADISIGTIELNKVLFNYIKDNMEFDQVILENGGIWVHVSIKRSGKNRKEVLYL